MRIFITGGTGFIGIHLCKKLLELGYTVTVYDNFSNSSQENFLSIIKNKTDLIFGDILDTSKLSSAMKDHDVVIHLAAQISVSESIKNPKFTFETNVQGTQNVLNACLENKIKKIIATSTAAVYQNVLSETILNESSPVEPLSPYGVSKLEMENKIINFASSNQVDAIILRLFNVYGDGQSIEYAGVITKFLFNIKNNNSLTIFGNGDQTRDFVHINDVVNSIVLSLENTSFGIYNIASGNSISILNLAKLMIKQSEKNLDILFTPSRSGEILFSNASILKANKQLGFIPQLQISEGLKLLKNNSY
jgi:UDP-glucose 4-epimerase